MSFVTSIILLLFKLALFPSGSESQIIFTKQPPSPSYVVEGNSLFLQWDYTLGGSLRLVRFQLIKTTVIIITDRGGSDEAAFVHSPYGSRVEANITATQTNITFLSLNRTDTGNYAIQVQRKRDLKINSTAVTITVQYPPEFTKVSDDVVLVEGEGDSSVTLECTADGEPTPSITWTRVYDNGSDSGVLTTGNQFDLENNRTNSGTYRCTAYNEIGTGPNRTVTVEVNFKPEIIKPLVNDSTVCEGDVINITCSAGSRPAVHTYQLFENGIIVVDGNSSAGVSILRSNLKEGNFSYRCVANNTVGTTEETVNIIVKESRIVFTKQPPSPFYVVEGNGLFLQWDYTLGGLLRLLRFQLIKTTAIIITERSGLDEVAFVHPPYGGRVEANIAATQTNITFLSLTRTDTGSYELQVQRNPDLKINSTAVTITVQYDEEVLNKKDMEWSSKNVSDVEATPSSVEQANLPAEDQQPSEQPEKSKEKSTLHKERTKQGESEASHPYAEFLADQRKREVEWASNRAAKKTKLAETSTKDLEAMKQQLDAKDAECAALKSQVHDLQRVNTSTVEAQNKAQESFCKMMERLEDSLSAMEDNMAARLDWIEYRLDSLEKMWVPIRPEYEDLPTIDPDALAHLHDELIEEIVPLPPTPTPLAVNSTPVNAPSTRPEEPIQSSVREIADVIRSCVTPRKVIGVQDVIQKENQRHKCALKLLPFFFSREELSNSNTEGTHNKLPLDSTRLNSLKVLVFSRFPVDSPVEKERVWKCIKSKINSKCRLSKHITKYAVERAD